jgi:hypothetical protein
MGELYGEYNLLTNEWTDGLGSTLIRGAVNDTTTDKKWVVFDGPVDAIWIENMNTGRTRNKFAVAWTRSCSVHGMAETDAPSHSYTRTSARCSAG